MYSLGGGGGRQIDRDLEGQIGGQIAKRVKRFGYGTIRSAGYKNGRRRRRGKENVKILREKGRRVQKGMIGKPRAVLRVCICVYIRGYPCV